MHTLQDYLSAEPLPLPAVHPNAKIIKVNSLVVFCKKCNGDTEDIRGSVIEHQSCLEIVAGGVCSKCNAVTWSRTRFYEEHFLAWRDSGVEKGTYPRSWLRRLFVWVATVWSGR